jgi:hypothetical protein
VTEPAKQERAKSEAVEQKSTVLAQASWYAHAWNATPRIQTTLDLYTDEDLDEMIAAQEKFLDAVGFESGSVQ